MSVLPQVATLLEWVRDGQERLEQAVVRLARQAVSEPSALPGWTRGAVLTHVSRNADALVNLLTWARTGTRTPMYSSPEQRDQDIAAGAGRGLAEQLADLRDSARRFVDAAAALSADQWSATVTSAQGRAIPVSEVPWLRVREVWIHGVDLDLGTGSGIGMDLLPPELAWTLAKDVAGWMSGRIDRRVELHAEGYGSVVAGPTETATDLVVSGSPNRLAAWLTGRASAEGLRADGEIPALPHWL